MALWLVRGGDEGQFEARFLRDGRIYFTWEGFKGAICDCKSRDDVRDMLWASYSREISAGRLNSHASQGWSFAGLMSRGDLVLMPLKGTPAVAVGEIAGEPEHMPGEEAAGFSNWRNVRWFTQDLPRAALDEETARTVGNFPATICQVRSSSGESHLRRALAAMPPAD